MSSAVSSETERDSPQAMYIALSAQLAAIRKEMRLEHAQFQARMQSLLELESELAGRLAQVKYSMATR